MAEAQRGADSQQIERIHNIMLASAGIPAAFPFRIIDGELYVDGGVTGNIIYGGRGAEEDTVPGIWAQFYPNVPMPKLRMWVIFNNQFRPVPVLTAPNWPAVIQRSLETATRAATATAYPAPVWYGRSIEAQTQSRDRGSCRVDSRRLGSAGAGNFRQRDHE